MRRLSVRRAILVLGVLASCVACDQATKVAAKTYLAPSLPVSMLGGMLRMQYILNPGALLSVGADLSSSLRFWFFTALVGILLMGTLLFLLFYCKMPSVGVIGVSLILGGGLSNLIDRLLNDGAVLDFMNISLWNLSTGIFNLADVTISLGMGFLVVLYVGGRYRSVFKK